MDNYNFTGKLFVYLHCVEACNDWVKLSQVMRFGYLSTGLDKQKFAATIVNIFLPIIFNICFGCSKELSHRDNPFEYP